MRLTLRTLLAYLDDTLGANEIKGIGEKVAESDAAQELIARIKQVTRRRRLTTPPASGPEAFDPNDVAEYLDNELEGDRIAKVEKQCLESDVHLAEIAACHQILTLVLGEPALVPPKAKERMYKLVTSRESIPFRKAAPARKTNPDGLDDEEELELGGGWLRWVLPAAGILLVVALSVAVYSILHKPTRPDPFAGNTRDKDRTKDGDNPKDGVLPPAKDKDGSAVVAKDVGKDGAKDDGGKGTPIEKDVTKDDGKPKPPEKDPGVVARTAPPNAKRAEIGSYRGGMTDIPTVLARRTADGWQALPEEAAIHSSDTLTALPGFTALVGTRGGVGLTLRGHIPPFSLSPRMNLLLESSVILHQSDDFDLDLTLVRGRVYVRNTKQKGPARVRIRFEKEVWDLTLSLPGDEAGFDLFKEYSAPIDHLTEPPHASLVLFMLSGDAQVNVDAFHTHALEATGDQSMILLWDGFRKTGTPQRLKMLPEFSKTPPSPDQVEGATRKTELRDAVAGLKNLQTLFNDKDKKDKLIVALRETLGGERPTARVLAIYCLAALDEPEKLVDVLGDEQQDHAVDRLVAVYALRHWLAAAQDQYKRLFDKDKEAGILIDRKYKVSEAKMVTSLLFDFSPEYFSKPETFEGLNRCLPHRRIAIAELGMWHLSRLAMGTKLPPGFNAARPVEDREKYSEAINKMILARLLPPAPMSLPPKD